MANMTTTAVLPPAVREYYDRLLLMTAFPQLVHTKFAQKRSLPKKMGDRIVFRRYNRLATVTVPLQDGITPPATPLSADDIVAQVDFYGNYVIITNQVELTVEDQVLNEATLLLSQNMGQTVDEVTRDVLASGATSILCSNGTNGSTPTELTKADIDSVVQSLLTNNAMMITDVIPAGKDFSTAAVRPSFMGIIDTALLDDLEDVSNFLSSSNYPSQQPVMEYEWGSTGNVRWVYTSVGSKSSASPVVYDNFIIAKEAYGVVNLGSDKGEFYVEPLGSAGAADPLHQRGSVGWQHPFTSRILNDTFLYNLMATHS